MIGRSVAICTKLRSVFVAWARNRAASRQSLPRHETSARFETGFDAPRRPQVQLIQGKRDGTTGLMIDDVADPFIPNGMSSAAPSFVGGLRRGAESAPAVAELPKDDYLDIPAFLRRQAD